MKAIYETKGRAREFCELAINLYTGCRHRCSYCYGADYTHHRALGDKLEQELKAQGKEWR